MLYGLKYIARVETSVYDLLFLFIIMITKILIEGVCYLTFYNIFNKFAFTMIIDALKILFIIIFRKSINKCYYSLKNKWNNNNFYIRYIFNILLFIYIMMSFVFIIIK